MSICESEINVLINAVVIPSVPVKSAGVPVELGSSMSELRGQNELDAVNYDERVYTRLGSSSL